VSSYRKALFVRAKGSNHLYQEFLTFSHTSKRILESHFLKHFPELTKELEFVVLERRKVYESSPNCKFFKVGEGRPVKVLLDRRSPEDLSNKIHKKHREIPKKQVKCLSIWHDKKPDTFLGSKYNHICPECVKSEKNYNIKSDNIELLRNRIDVFFEGDVVPIKYRTQREGKHYK